MFGLMSPPRSCAYKKQKNYRHYRMHYCGTCKTLGKHYNQSARLLLNFDTVFLAELLSSLHQEDLSQWAPSFQAINQCLTLPKAKDKTPFSLEYVAATNMVLTAFKINDNIQDKKQFRWQLSKLFYYRPVSKAFSILTAFDISKEELYQWQCEQTKRELQKSTSHSTLETYLNHFAEPTAQITALFFKKGVATLSKEVQSTMKALGYQFGRLNYILDAFEDLEQDIFNQQFNPLANWFNANKTIADYQLEQVRLLLLDIQNSISQNITSLPLEFRASYISRLESNLAMRLYAPRIIPQTRKEKVIDRWQSAQEYAQKIIPSSDFISNVFQHFLISFSIFVVPSIIHKMPKKEQTIQWQWKLLFTTLWPFSTNQEILDDSLPEEEQKIPPKQNYLENCCCFCGDCGSCGSCGETGGAATTTTTECGCADCGSAECCGSADCCSCADCGCGGC